MKTKRLLAILLCALMLAGMLPVGALAEEAAQPEKVKLSFVCEPADAAVKVPYEQAKETILELYGMAKEHGLAEACLKLWDKLQDTPLAVAASLDSSLTSGLSSLDEMFFGNGDEDEGGGAR